MNWKEEYYRPGRQAVWEEGRYIFIVRKNPDPIPSALTLILTDWTHKSPNRLPTFCYTAEWAGTVKIDMGDKLWTRSFEWDTKLWREILADPLPWFMEGML